MSKRTAFDKRQMELFSMAEYDHRNFFENSELIKDAQVGQEAIRILMRKEQHERKVRCSKNKMC